MNLFKPRPEPATALLAIIFAVFGFFTLEKTGMAIHACLPRSLNGHGLSR